MNKEGFYGLSYQGQTGQTGFGVIVLDTGMVVGVDVIGGTIDGTYEPAGSGLFRIVAKFKAPPGGGHLVQGVTVPGGFEFQVEAVISSQLGAAPTKAVAKTPFGPVSFEIRKIRDFPN